MPKHASEAVRCQFIGIQGQIVRYRRFAEPLHVVFDEDLNDLAIDAAPALERSPCAAGR